MVSLNSIDILSLIIGGVVVMATFGILMFFKNWKKKKKKKVLFVGLRDEIMIGHEGARVAAQSLKKIHDILGEVQDG